MDLPEFLYGLAPVTFAFLLIITMIADWRARSLAAGLLGATIMLGYNGHPLARFVWVPWEFLMVGILLWNLRLRRVWNNQGVLACFFFLTAALVSLGFAAARAGGLNSAILGGVFNVGAVTIAAAFLLADIRISKKHEAALKYFGLATFLISLTGLYEAALHPGVRVSGIYVNANVFAYMMAMGFMVTVHYWRGWLRILFSACLLITVGLTVSRAGYLMIAAFGMWKAWELATARRWVPLTALLAVGLAAGLIGGQALNARYSISRNQDAERVLIYRSVELAYKQHPLTGIGWSQFRHQYRNYGAYRLSSDTFELDNKLGFFGNRGELPTHNDYVAVLVEMGTPLAILIMGLFGYSGWIALFRPSPMKSIVTPLFIGNAIYSTTHNMSNSITFFYFMFLPLAFYQLRRSDSVTQRPARPKPRRVGLGAAPGVDGPVDAIA